MEAIYEDSFEKNSYRFRPCHSRHTDLSQIQVTFTDIKCFVEGDIKGFDNDNIDYEIMVNILAECIKNERFMVYLQIFQKDI